MYYYAWLKQDEEGVDICRHQTRHLVEVGRRKMERRSKVSILSQGSGCGYLRLEIKEILTNVDCFIIAGDIFLSIES